MRLKTIQDHLPIYLDCHSTTPVDQRVACRMMDAMLNVFGNPNSGDHSFGKRAEDLVESAREELGLLVGAPSSRIHFFSSASQAIDRALLHALWRRKDKAKPLRVAATAVEHRAVLGALHAHASDGSVEWHVVEVDSNARVLPESLRQACEQGADLLCVMAANNEVGTINPIEDIAKVARLHNSQILVDASQAAGFIPFSVDKWGLDYTVLCAHKMYGPKGVGALIVGPDSGPSGPLLSAHEGTPNVPGIVGFGEACRLRRICMKEDVPRIASLRDHLQKELQQRIPSMIVNGDPTNRLCGNLHVSVPGVPGDAVTARLYHQVAISTGAACSYGANEDSHVLKAMKVPPIVREGALRIGLGVYTTQSEIDTAAVLIASAVDDIKRVVMQ